MTFVPSFFIRYKSKRHVVTWRRSHTYLFENILTTVKQVQVGLQKRWICSAIEHTRCKSSSGGMPVQTRFHLWRMFWCGCVVWECLPFTNSDVVHNMHTMLFDPSHTASPAISDPKLQCLTTPNNQKLMTILCTNQWCQKAKYLFYPHLSPLAPSSEGKTGRSGWVFFFMTKCIQIDMYHAGIL